MDKATTQAISDVRAEARTSRVRGSYFWIIAAVYMIISPAIAVLVARQISIQATDRAVQAAVAESEMKLCTIVVLSDDYYKRSPPALPAGKAQAAAMAQLRAEYHCPPRTGAGK